MNLAFLVRGDIVSSLLNSNAINFFQNAERFEITSEKQQRLVQSVRPAPNVRGHPVSHPEGPEGSGQLYEGPHEDGEATEEDTVNSDRW